MNQIGRSFHHATACMLLLLFSQLLGNTSLASELSYELSDQQLKTSLQAAAPPSESGLSARFTAGLRGSFFEDAFNRDSLSAVYFKLSAEQELLENLDGNAEVQTVFEQGTSQGLANRNTRRSTGFYLRDAKIFYTPLKWMSLQAGAIDQAGLNSQLLVASQPFPALRQRIRLHCSETGCTELVTQQAIPTSQTLSSRAVEKEALPGFFSGSFATGYNLSELSRFRFVTGYYHFQRLPQTVAGESCDLGNSVSSCLPNAQFLYGFSGVQSKLSLWLALSSGFTWTNEIEYLQNFDAPAGRAQGYKLGSGFILRTSASSTLQVGAAYIEKQSDVAPSFYSNWLLEGNRRIGLGEVLWRHLPTNLALKLRVADSTPLAENGFQQRMTNVMFSMEKSYAAIE